MKIPFNKPYLSGNELLYIKQAVDSGKLSGDGLFTSKSQNLIQALYGFKKTLLTTSCTDALEMAAILLDIKAGDEVIAPSFTFVSTVNAFVLRGAKIVFADSNSDNPNMDTSKLQALVTKNTKAIIPVHYAGIACDMDAIINIAAKNDLFIVEDAAQGIDSFYKDRALGSMGTFGAFSFHETKNIISGEGGMLSINDEKFNSRAEIIREKGTNRSAFFRGEVDKYGWVDIGSSFLPSELNAAFLFAQIENITKIQKRRLEIWNKYYTQLLDLADLGVLKLPVIPRYATNNGHMFYILCENLDVRTRLIDFLKSKGILAVFHYSSLHRSNFYKNLYDGLELPYSDFYTNCLIRLPLYYELSDSKIIYITNSIKSFFKKSYAWS